MAGGLKEIHCDERRETTGHRFSRNPSPIELGSTRWCDCGDDFLSYGFLANNLIVFQNMVIYSNNLKSNDRFLV